MRICNRLGLPLLRGRTGLGRRQRQLGVRWRRSSRGLEMWKVLAVSVAVVVDILLPVVLDPLLFVDALLVVPGD